ncbi:MAG: hypothetical protein KGI97_05090, partial [Alphaproteobacteria bacterium]|nr:hypothetical protein [Alphaproteobacteria bacterium]
GLQERTTGKEVRGYYAGFSAEETRDYQGVYVEYLHLQKDGVTRKLPLKAYNARATITRPTGNFSSETPLTPHA